MKKMIKKQQLLLNYILKHFSFIKANRIQKSQLQLLFANNLLKFLDKLLNNPLQILSILLLFSYLN